MHLAQHMPWHIPVGGSSRPPPPPPYACDIIEYYRQGLYALMSLAHMCHAVKCHSPLALSYMASQTAMQYQYALVRIGLARLATQLLGLFGLLRPSPRPCCAACTP